MKKSYLLETGIPTPVKAAHVEPEPKKCKTVVNTRKSCVVPNPSKTYKVVVTDHPKKNVGEFTKNYRYFGKFDHNNEQIGKHFTFSKTYKKITPSLDGAIGTICGFLHHHPENERVRRFLSKYIAEVYEAVLKETEKQYCSLGTAITYSKCYRDLSDCLSMIKDVPSDWMDKMAVIEQKSIFLLQTAQNKIASLMVK